MNDYEPDADNGDGSSDGQQETDRWGQPVEHNDPELGARARAECSGCGGREDTVALVGGTSTDAESDNFEEYYECQYCGATGTYRVEDGRSRWLGRIESPDDDPRVMADGGVITERDAIIAPNWPTADCEECSYSNQALSWKGANIVAEKHRDYSGHAVTVRRPGGDGE